MCLKRPKCGRQPKKFSHNEMCAARYVIVFGEMVNLSTKKVQETPKERMRGKGKTSINMGGEKDALTLARLGLGFPFRQPPRSMSNQAVLGELLQVLSLDGGMDPVSLDPTRQQTGPRR